LPILLIDIQNKSSFCIQNAVKVNSTDRTQRIVQMDPVLMSSSN